MELSVIIPIFNEERNLFKNCKTVYDFLKKNCKDFELILVNDGSKDDSTSEIKRFGEKKKEVVFVDYAENRGKGHAVKKGIEVCSKKNVMFMDADLATPVSEIKNLYPKLKEANCVIGSRAMSESKIDKKQSWHRILLGRFGNLLIQLLLIPGIKDTQCGFKMFNTKVAKKIFKKMRIERWGFDFEVLYLCRKMKEKIVEVPVIWSDKDDSKINLFSYIQTLFELLKIKWNNLRGLYRK